MASSILTNNGAMVALQSLQATQKSLADTQTRISTGLKVGSAKDNAATWAVATSMRSDIANYKQVSENLSVSSSVVGTAQNGAEQITSLMTQIRAKVTAAQESTFDSRTIQNDIDSLVGQIESTIQSSAFKGTNLLNEAGNRRIIASVNQVNGVSTPSYLNVATLNMSTESGGDLNALKQVSVVSRGDQLFNDPTAALTTAAQRAMGTTGTTFTVADYNSTTPTNSLSLSNAAGDLTVNYKDADGAARTLSVNLAAGVQTVADAITALNADEDFSKLFRASGASGALTISAADRVTQSGSFAVTGIAATGKVLTNGTVPGATTGSTFTFQDGTALKEGETFTFTYKLGATAKTLVLKATNDPVGTAYLAKDVVNNIEYRTINLDAANTKNASGAYEGDNIAAAFIAAINSADDFASGAAVAGASLGVAAVSGAVVSITANTADAFVAFQPVQTNYNNILNNLDALDKKAKDAAAAFGAAGSRIDSQKTFIDKLTDTLTAGVGSLVDADMSAEAARLQALQVQQQLGTQALSIANQAPQSILSLFK